MTRTYLRKHLILVFSRFPFASTLPVPRTFKLVLCFHCIKDGVENISDEFEKAIDSCLFQVSFCKYIASLNMCFALYEGCDYDMSLVVESMAYELEYGFVDSYGVPLKCAP